MSGWIFYPSHDCHGGVICHVGRQPAADLIAIAEAMGDCYSFNTNGWMKHPSYGFNIHNYEYPNGGSYVRLKADEVLQKYEEIKKRGGLFVDNLGNVLGPVDEGLLWNSYLGMDTENVNFISGQPRELTKFYSNNHIDNGNPNANNPNVSNPNVSNPQGIIPLNVLHGNPHANKQLYISVNDNVANISDPTQQKQMIEFMESAYDHFIEMFKVKNVSSCVLQTIGNHAKVVMGRDDKTLKYNKIIVINPTTHADIEKDLAKIFYDKYILTTCRDNFLNIGKDLGYNNIVPNQDMEEMLNNINPSESLSRIKKKSLLIVNTELQHGKIEQDILKKIPKSTQNISQLIINIHNICIGNKETIEGMFYIFEYIAQDFFVVSFTGVDYVKFGNISYPKHVSISYINRNLYSKNEIRDVKIVDNTA